MRATIQKRLAIACALAALAVFATANAHFVATAFRSQPKCTAIEGAPLPAKRVC
jgi:hypothetical protein